MQHYETDKIRSFALVGHGGCGKTSVAEALAFLTGRNSRLGSVAEHTSIMDFEDEEKKRGGSISASFLTTEYDGFRVHVIDTPGDGNFVHEARTAMQGADAAFVVVSAVDGVEVSTEKVVGFAKELGLPTAVLINKMDREYADVPAVMKDLKETLDLEPVLLQMPIGTQDSFRGVVDLVYRRAWTYDNGVVTESDIPADLQDAVATELEHLMDIVAATDDDLVEKYLEHGELTQDEIRLGLNAAILAGTITPVILGSATKLVGMDKVMWLSRAFPHAGERGHFAVHAPGEPDEPVERLAKKDAPFAALCVKTFIDLHAGAISVFRVVSGTAHTGDSFTNPANDASERLGNLYFLKGKDHDATDEVVPGDVFGVPKLKETHTGDTLCDPRHPAQVAFVPAPEPMMAYTITPASRKDVDKLKTAITRLLAEDAGLKQSYDETSHEVMLAGQGASHVQISVEKLARKFGVSVDLGTPSIPYRETISGTADIRYRHKKQTGGAGQFAEVAIRVSPSERGEGFVFVNAVKGGVIPTALIPSVEKGVHDKLQAGILAGYPAVDVKVELYDGKYHPVDSKDIAYQIAGRQAIKQAFEKARPGLLEPIYEVSIVAPTEMVGDIMGDMNGRRGRILNMDTRGRNSIVKALAPLAELLNYAPELRSMTGGKGSYSLHFHSYEPVPAHLMDKVLATASRLVHHDEDE